VFDLGDNWQHLCTIGDQRVDPVKTLGIVPDKPLPCLGWGDIPDQYGRRWASDDGESDLPGNPHGADLPPILPEWGPPAPRR
jgi:hypothetical protein